MAASAPPGGAPPQRFAFRTTDPDEAQDFIGRMYHARPPTAGHVALTAPVAISQVSAGGLSHVDFAMPPDVTLRLDGTDDVSVTTVITGGTHAERGQDTERYGPGDSFLGSFPGSYYTVRCVDLRAGTVTVPAAALAQAAGEVPGQGQPALRFGSLRPVSAAAAAQWQQAADYARGLLNDDHAAASPLIMGSAARLLAATALAVFPHEVLPSPAAADSRDAHSGALRRAKAFIDENAHTDISVADVAAAAFVTPRAVQLAFRRHLGTTPMEYLRQVRLDHAHAQLLASDARQVTVTSVAYQWGFPSTSRFAVYYRHAYGVTPSHTLRHH